MQLFIVDAFTTEPFHGNPAGVVLLSMQEPPPPVRFMQQLAAELRHSETVFVQPTGPRDFTLRYFTPAEEAALCGHATLSAFTVLRETGRLAPGLYHAHTAAGTLAISLEKDRCWLEVAPPKLLHTFQPSQWKALYQAFALPLSAKPNNLFPQTVNVGLSDILLPVRSPALLQAAQPDRAQIIALSKACQAVGIHLYALSPTPEATALCRNFAPLYGIDEEAATGTANAALTYSLYQQGRIQAGTINTFAQGAALQRPAQIYTRLDGQRLQVGGQACLVFSGTLAPALMEAAQL